VAYVFPEGIPKSTVVNCAKPGLWGENSALRTHQLRGKNHQRWQPTKGPESENLRGGKNQGRWITETFRIVRGVGWTWPGLTDIKNCHPCPSGPQNFPRSGKPAAISKIKLAKKTRRIRTCRARQKWCKRKANDRSTLAKEKGEGVKKGKQQQRRPMRQRGRPQGDIVTHQERGKGRSKGGRCRKLTGRHATF